jgi:hypothetical protein
MSLTYETRLEQDRRCLKAALNTSAISQEARAAQLRIEALGWVKQSEKFENGFYPGQNDDPHEIAAALVIAGKEYFFQIGDVRQFDVCFHVWVKE